ncbi:hypothetical protein BT69DRAFT_913141 [Atractiella rhizophila]|nr:hypothetical protein BT69DRAFT_913141 [Atractiella rhizophila]
MGEVITSARRLLHADEATSHEVWIALFKVAWSCLSETEQSDITRLLTVLLAKEYHMKSVEWKPSMSKTLLSGALACDPLPNLPPQLIRYLGKTFSAFHTAIEYLENQSEDYQKDDAFRLTSLDSLTDLYAELNEVDYTLVHYKDGQDKWG